MSVRSHEACGLGTDEGGAPLWNARFLDFALRLGVEAKLCHAYRPQSTDEIVKADPAGAAREGAVR